MPLIDNNKLFNEKWKDFSDIHRYGARTRWLTSLIHELLFLALKKIKSEACLILDAEKELLHLVLPVNI